MQPPAAGSDIRTSRCQLATFRPERCDANVVTEGNYDSKESHVTPHAFQQHRRPHGRWSANHWKTAFFGWLAFVLASLVVGMQVGTKQLANDDASVGESHRAE